MSLYGRWLSYTRVSCCRRAFYGLSGAGMSYPGINTDAKCYLWKSVCSPSLLYGMECLNINTADMSKLQSTQGACMKEALGLRKRSHHTHLLGSLYIDSVKDYVITRSTNLLHRIFQHDSPARDLNIHLLNLYTSYGKYYPNTLIGRIIGYGFSPYTCILSKPKTCSTTEDNGVVDSLRYLLHQENYIKPWSLEHSLVNLLVSCF